MEIKTKPVIKKRYLDEDQDLFETFCCEGTDIFALKRNGEIHKYSLRSQYKKKSNSLVQYVEKLPEQAHTTIHAVDGSLFTSSISADILEANIEIASIVLLNSVTLKPLSSIYFKYSSHSLFHATRNPIHKLTSFGQKSLLLARAYSNYIFLLNCRGGRLAIQDCWSLSDSPAPIFSCLLLKKTPAVALSFKFDISSSALCILPIVNI